MSILKIVCVLHRKLFQKNLYEFLVTYVVRYFWLTEWNILHSTVALCATYLILLVFGGSFASALITFLFNMGYLLIGTCWFFITCNNHHRSEFNIFFITCAISAIFHAYEEVLEFYFLRPRNKKWLYSQMQLKNCEKISVTNATFLVIYGKLS